jgi:hypothetical protein
MSAGSYLARLFTRIRFFARCHGMILIPRRSALAAEHRVPCSGG